LVHLVGSVPYASSEEVFATVAMQLPGRLQQMPDGETKERGGFTAWQTNVLPPQIIHHQFRLDEPSTFDPNFSLTAEDIRETGYDTAALASYATFRQMREDGRIPSGIRFQVSLPTPMNVIGSKVHPQFVEQAEALYEKRLLDALQKIQDSIPASDLAIQWDMALEMAHMEHAYGPPREGFTYLQPYYSPVKQGIAERAARLATHVRPEVPMGYHFCYGDFRHEHFVQPRDAGLLVEIINAVTQSVRVEAQRGVQWVHLPVPKDRDDDAYYAPLSQLTASDETKLIMGLVHAHDREGTRRRVAAAQRTLSGRQFGVSTECGLGRTPLGDLDSIWDICREVTGVSV
jgi:hypothetical protein